jgi:hypothetical protein
MRLFRKRHVRLHLSEPDPSLEGFLVGKVSGHYRLLRPKLLEAADRTHSLEGEAWIPCERVVFVQVLR